MQRRVFMCELYIAQQNKIARPLEEVYFSNFSDAHCSEIAIPPRTPLKEWCRLMYIIILYIHATLGDCSNQI